MQMLICRLFLLFRCIVSDRAIAPIYLERTATFTALVRVAFVAMGYLNIKRRLAVGAIHILLPRITTGLHRLPVPTNNSVLAGGQGLASFPLRPAPD